uniref:Cytochrome P450 n=1 Tax=Panagrolaimus sp. JU765 TaxID=591449 RepID=A0AC34R901_9BILA
MGNTPIVTIHDSPTIYATFLKDGEAYTGRHLTDAGALARNGRNGVILVDGDLWREHRRFTLHVLRDFGLGKNLMQERILDEVTHTIADIKQDLENGAKVLSIQNELDRAVGSIINLLLFGYRFGR